MYVNKKKISCALFEIRHSLFFLEYTQQDFDGCDRYKISCAYKRADNRTGQEYVRQVRESLFSIRKCNFVPEAAKGCDLLFHDSVSLS